MSLANIVIEGKNEANLKEKMNIDIIWNSSYLKSKLSINLFKDINSILTNFLKETDQDLHDLLKESTLEVIFSTDKDIQDINKSLRNKDKPTDVLSWNLYDRDTKMNFLAGEIHISDKYVEKQAQNKKKDLEEEVLFLITHGFLHVVGYDHQTDEEELIMNQNTDKILKDLGIDYYKKLG